MLGKLIKYDLKWIYKVVIVFYILATVFSVIARMCFSIENSMLFNILGKIASGVAISMVVNSIINTVMRSWARFVKNIYKDESYLTHTLPIKKNTIYLSKVLSSLISIFTSVVVSVICLFICYYSKENMEVFWRIAPKLGLSSEQFMIIDHKESFYHFALSQPESLWIHDVYLFENDGKNLFYYGLKRNTRTKPQMISIKEGIKNPVESDAEQDREFLGILRRAFENQIVTTAYLVGEGFEGGWMKESLNFLCKNRRVFMGNNLYSKGACYAGFNREHPERWKFIYMGEHEMKFNLSLKVRDCGNMAFHTLISAGQNWFETKGDCEVILMGTPEIEFWKQLPNSRDAVIESLELTDLPNRPDRTTRLRITATPISDEKIEVEIKDMGFGEIYRSTDKTRKYTMMM